MYNDNETTTLMPQDGNSWAVVANLTDSADKNSRISSALRNRWTPYGAPAPEAADAISPFISGFELQAHLLAGDAATALDLIRLQWGFMLDDPRMTNSTFIEGYQSNGDLHYAPYSNDPRISHAHGWATGPTSTLTFYFGGIHLLSAAGKTWEIAPTLGGLRHIDTGFSTTLGHFSTNVLADQEGNIQTLSFVTPPGTSGRVVLLGFSGSLIGSNGTSIPLVNGTAENVPGGHWNTIGQQVASGAGKTGYSMWAGLGAAVAAAGLLT